MNKAIAALIADYNSVMRVMDKDATTSADRAYGGYLRATKGKLQEHITEEIIKIAWGNLRGKRGKTMEINSAKQKIPICCDYIKRLPNGEIKRRILKNCDDYYCNLSVDKQVFIDGKLCIGVECKAYAENAMLKRILVDFTLLKTLAPWLRCYLFQLESQLGGDYSQLGKTTHGSKPTHALMSYFANTPLHIVTFLKGERKIAAPIHKKGNFKPLKSREIKKAVALLQQDMRRFIAP